ncbi:hypothetical protein Pmani_031057 [Petrolisthes manimaculis]|uniref:Uncharacterized protein n=1 Tax=Petrolisthes manimaculis TaxID=1843537 RepID=A0AAE1NUE9_9EUCA|nr:hypothetical protein Pmani_031057 [Petrolisthes manimaculis]
MEVNCKKEKRKIERAKWVTLEWSQLYRQRGNVHQSELKTLGGKRRDAGGVPRDEAGTWGRKGTGGPTTTTTTTNMDKNKCVGDIIEETAAS